MDLNLSFIRQSSALIIPDLIKIITTVITSIVLAKILGPEQLGVYSSAALVMTYGVLLHSGIKNGTGLNIPILIGKGLQKESEITLRHAMSGIIAILIITTPVFVVITYSLIHRNDLLIGMLIIWSSLFLYEIYNMIEAQARLNYRIKTVFYSQTILVISRLFLIIILSMYFGILGAFIALFVSYIPSLVYLVYIKKEIIKFEFSMQGAQELIKVGFPLLFAGIMMTVFTSLDRLFILSDIGLEKLGYYTFIVGMTTVIAIIPAKIASFMSQYLREALGANVNQNKLSEVTGILYISSLIILVPIVLIIYHLGVYIITGYLYEYKLSLDFLDVLIFSSLNITAFHFYSQYLVALGAKKELIYAQICALIFALIFYSLAMWMQKGLYGFSFANLLSSSSLSLMMLIFSYKSGARLKDLKLGYTILIISFCVAAIWFINISDLKEISSLNEGKFIILKLLTIDFLIFLLALLFIRFSRMFENIKGFLQRDFKYKETT
jgi:O-antigen/teichoic acid export membrane protein